MAKREAPIPVIDIGNITSQEATEANFADVGKKLVEALKKCGFLYLVNHGFDKDTISHLNSNAALFFNLEEETKLKYCKKNICGYQPIGRENLAEETQDTITAGKSADEKVIPIDAYRESFDYNRYEEDADILNVVEVPALKSALSQFYKEGQRLSEKIIRALEYGLELPSGTLLDLHKSLTTNGKNTVSTIRSLCYPGILEDQVLPKGALRCGAHSDYGTFTFLFQDNVEGLEILNKDNVWQPAKPMEGALVFNLGDNLETFTAGRLTATKHRVVIPLDIQCRKMTRRSYALFIHADNEVDVKPLLSIADQKRSSMSVLQFYEDRIARSRSHALRFY